MMYEEVLFGIGFLSWLAGAIAENLAAFAGPQ